MGAAKPLPEITDWYASSGVACEKAGTIKKECPEGQKCVEGALDHKNSLGVKTISNAPMQILSRFPALNH
ncbi:hypothetical protein [Niabella hibiscisoli]|uniref:hypothetical protein n=1 Tax=Niabella hibiscisoli TaxID=1825928 RepID=UPI001F111D2C|nr:hypothetical protein [Niabella hibiscisoli]MCH5716056.1 hypothetical protein [Niabella hibiscisoli]